MAMTTNAEDGRHLDGWEDEGGSVGATPRATEERRHTSTPALPVGYQAQTAWGFHDRTGYSYEFNRVYGPPGRLGDRGSVTSLDEDLSYWSVSWSTRGETGEEVPAGKSMSYAEARALWGPLKFERFSSLAQMREELPRLLRGEVRMTHAR